MSRIGRASAQTMASRMMVSSLSCRVSPDVDQFVEPEIRHRPSTILHFAVHNHAALQRILDNCKVTGHVDLAYSHSMSCLIARDSLFPSVEE